jgi:lipopolysaccharide export system protein LptA
MHGTAPTMDLQFNSKGALRLAHLERDVQMQSEEHSVNKSGPLRVSRSWRSPVADLEFRDAGHGKMEPGSIHGSGGVLVTSESQQGKEPVQPSHISADDLRGEFGPGSALTGMTGIGHAVVEQTTPTGARQTTLGDRLDVRFQMTAKSAPHANGKSDLKATGAPGDTTQIQSATVEGHVVLTQQPVAKHGEAAPQPLQATAGRAVYAESGEWLHLTENPRVVNGGLELTADKLDLSQATGDAFARGRVKATWLGSAPGEGQAAGNSDPGRNRNTVKARANSDQASSMVLGGDGPAHVIADEAQLHQATSEATFRGQARLWQGANSISAPTIVMDRTRQTLEAHSANPHDPVRAVLVSATAITPGPTPGKDKARKPSSPSIVRIQGGEMKYSAAARKATMEAGSLSEVVADTGTATTHSNSVEVILLPPGNHAGKDGAEAQVDRMTARGHVILTSAGRRGTGEQLIYSSETGEYVLTGTIPVPPTMTDSVRGKISGEALIFDSQNDSVRVEGGVTKSTTETHTPR